MVTLQTADNALKTFYLDAVAEEIDSKINPFLAMIEKTSANVSGKGVAKLVRVGGKGGVGAGTETGALPTAKANEYITLTASLKNLYGTIEISDKAIRASANSEGAFVNILNDEMESLVKGAKDNFSRMLFGDGTGTIGVTGDRDIDEVEMDTVEAFKVGMDTYFYLAGSAIGPVHTVLSVNKEAKTVTFSNMPEDNVQDLSGLNVVPAETAYGQEITGLGAIFKTWENLYGVERTYGVMNPYMKFSIGDITEAKIQKAIDDIEENSGRKINLILCSRGVRRALVAYCRANDIPLPTMDLYGTTVISLNGIPVLTDDYCPAGRIYLLNTDSFKLYQLCDWQWMEGESGKILKQVPGTPVYTATLVKYAELLCEKPSAQGVLMGVNEA